MDFIVEKLVLELDFASTAEYHSFAAGHPARLERQISRWLEEYFRGTSFAEDGKDHYFEEILLELENLRKHRRGPHLAMEDLALAAIVTPPLVGSRDKILTASGRKIRSNEILSEGGKYTARPSSMSIHSAGREQVRIHSLHQYLLIGQFITGAEWNMEQLLSYFSATPQIIELEKWVSKLPESKQVVISKRMRPFMGLGPDDVSINPQTHTESPKRDQASGSVPVATTDPTKADKIEAAPNLEINKTGPRFRERSESILSEGVGVILIAPFIQGFYNKVNLLNQSGKDFKDEDARQEAIHCLAYIAHGNHLDTEHGTGVFKLLCGLPLTAPLDLSVDLLEATKTTADRLLLHVNKTWGIKLGENINALRHNFLQREGALRLENGRWELTVATKSIDQHLMSGITWSYQLVKLPWMEQFLHTNWL